MALQAALGVPGGFAVADQDDVQYVSVIYR
jgi:hypothetical protein